MSCIYYVLYQGNLSSVKLEKASVDCLVPPIMHMQLLVRLLIFKKQIFG